MSSVSYSIHCPSCDTVIWEDNDSHDGPYAACYNCGWYRCVMESQLTLKEINRLRKEQNEINGTDDEQLKMLRKLPKCRLN